MDKTAEQVAVGENLTSLIARLKEVRGDDWVGRSNALHRHIAELPDECRIMAIGEHRLRCYHGPAALIYDARLTAERVVVHYAQQDGSIADWGQVQNFHSNVPHRAIAREVFVYGDDDKTAILQEQSNAD